MGYFKLCISTLKYLPQMYWNYQRKSTVGWSIFNIIMDLTGGSLSFLQMLLEVLFGEHI
jgi:cystinosin